MIKSAKKYTVQPEDVSMIKLTTDDEKVLWVPIDSDNRHYAEILRLVKTGQLEIKEADSA